MVWYGMAWYGVVWCGIVLYGMVRYGVVWRGVVWYGMVRYGMAPFDTVCPISLHYPSRKLQTVLFESCRLYLNHMMTVFLGILLKYLRL